MLYIVGTPIGNLGDISNRAKETLENASVIICEDTRRARILLSAINISIKNKRLISFNLSNENQKIESIKEILLSGRDVVMISDAGMPGISDPGYLIVRLALDNAVDITTVPGPTALISALILSGFDTSKFYFEGFLPRKLCEKKEVLLTVSRLDRTVVIYETANRISSTLELMLEVLGTERRAFIGRELTKKFEEHVWGSISSLYNWSKSKEIKGEIVLVVQGLALVKTVTSADPYGDYVLLTSLGVDPKIAIAYIAKKNRVKKREIYDLVKKI